MRGRNRRPWQRGVRHNADTIMGGYTTTSITAYANLTDITKQGPLKPLKIHLSTRVLCFHQIFKEAQVRFTQLSDDLEFEQVFEEFRTEIEKRGRVIMLYVPRTGQQAGNVYMEFSSVEAAKAIRKIMFGRMFNGSPLYITYIPSQKFHQREFGETVELDLKING